ncbi:hypothetical protein R1sor_012621 [Riccia sorocarpa]|uniref:Uncharacterized protein n=1 Tax=Riccia sorocarpa TaxID=122646 RepID=A0ABD3I7W4_9MARC
MQVHEDPSEVNKDRFEKTLQAARQREQADTRISRVKCRIKWLKDGTRQAEATYGDLYFVEVECTEVREQRWETLQLVDKTITREQNRTLAQMPSDGFIQEIVLFLHQEKSPGKATGFDGVTVEVLMAGWEFMSKDYYHMVQKVKCISVVVLDAINCKFS